nr:hypothetical protein [Ningiella sp. W23]
MMLRDTEDEASVALYQEPSKSLSIDAGQLQRSHLTSFEERELEILQLRGMHNLEWSFLEGVGVDWQYTDSTATTSIPGELEVTVRDEYADGEYQRTFYNGSLGGNPYLYRFVELEDDVENWGVNVNKVFTLITPKLKLRAAAILLKKRVITAQTF